MHTRTYAFNDESAVIELWQKCGLTRPWNNPKRDIERKLEDSPELFFVGEANGKLVASVMAGYDGHRGWVYYLAVDPACQKQGYGRLLMEHAENHLLKIGCPKIDLMVRNMNSDVIAFYERIGYGKEEVVTMSRRLKEDPR